jgi:hypothetical protein
VLALELLVYDPVALSPLKDKSVKGMELEMVLNNLSTSKSMPYEVGQQSPMGKATKKRKRYQISGYV